MKATARWMIAAALVSVAVAGCDAPTPADRAASPSAEAAIPSAEVLAEALGDPDAYARARRLGALLPTLGPEAVAEVKQTLAHFPFDLGAVEFELLLRFWASHDPSAATAWALGPTAPRYKILAIHVAVELWAQADPTAAVAGATGAADSFVREVAQAVQLALVQGWFQTDRPGLEKYIYGLGSGIKRQRSLFAYALALAAAEGSDAAMRWGESISEDDTRYKLAVYRQVLSALAWADTPAAVRFCDAHCDGPYAKGLRNVLVRTRLRNGDYGGDVVEWVARVPDGDEQQRQNKQHSLWVAYATWAFQDREAALDWMAEKTAGEPEPWVRLLIGEYARQLAADSPAEAIEWAERVEDDVDRERTLIRIARAWREQDEDAAEAWLSRSSLSERALEQARNTKLPTYLPEASPR